LVSGNRIPRGRLRFNVLGSRAADREAGEMRRTEALLEVISASGVLGGGDVNIAAWVIASMKASAARMAEG
jgi:hypothetical protein